MPDVEGGPQTSVSATYLVYKVDSVPNDRALGLGSCKRGSLGWLQHT